MYSNDCDLPCHPQPVTKGQGMVLTYAYSNSPAGRMFVAQDGEAIVFMGIVPTDKTKANPLERAKAYFPKAEFRAGQLKPAKRIDLYGTAFRQKVWKVLLKIPKGKTQSYGDVAKKVGNPKGARAVGNAVGANPVSPLIPCHRVIQSNGNINNYGWGNDIKRRLLELEAK